MISAVPATVCLLSMLQLGMFRICCLLIGCICSLILCSSLIGCICSFVICGFLIGCDYFPILCRALIGCICSLILCCALIGCDVFALCTVLWLAVAIFAVSVMLWLAVIIFSLSIVLSLALCPSYSISSRECSNCCRMLECSILNIYTLVYSWLIILKRCNQISSHWNEINFIRHRARVLEYVRLAVVENLKFCARTLETNVLRLCSKCGVICSVFISQCSNAHLRCTHIHFEIQVFNVFIS